MKYYLSINSWNLLESFVTESISPFSFYGKRNFGNSLSRYLGSSSEKINYLILSDKDQGGDYTIVLDEKLLDKTSLVKIKGLKSSYTYNKTIFYKKGAVSFRFDNPELKSSLIAESKILFEVKCIEKYEPSFFCNPVKRQADKKTIKKLGESFSFEMQNFIDQDDLYNSVKGAVVGFARGAMTMSNPDVQVLISKVRDLKNTFAGLNTQIMVNNTPVEQPETIICAIQLCKQQYNKVCSERTNMFDILLHQFNNINSLAKDRAKELQEGSSNTYDKSELEYKKASIENQIMAFQQESGYASLKKELDEIKMEEVRRGEIQGKTRCYFKSGTPEYERKKELRTLLDEYEQSNAELKQLRFEYNLIKQQLMEDKSGKSHLDNTIATIFARVSDIMIDLQKKVAGLSTHENINLDSVTFTNNELSLTGIDSAEMDYFNVLLNHVLQLNHKEAISDAVILKIIEDSCNKYKNIGSYNSENGQKIVNCLRDYWKYKNQKAVRFDIPEDLPILQAIMSFFIKPYGFDQIERFMLNKKFNLKSHALMLWGASRGFADLPKTFTGIIYENDSITSLVDIKLSEISHIIKN